MAFPLFLLLTCIFFIRPDDIITAMAKSRLYLGTFVVCLLFAFRELSLTLRRNTFLTDPISCCILMYGMVFTVSNVINVGMYEAREKGIEFLKLYFYYLLFISLITTPERLRIFLKTVVFSILIISAIVLLDHHELIHLEAIEPVIQNDYDEDGSILNSYPRLRYLGTLQDPNDLSMILGVGMIMTIYLYSIGVPMLRVLWGIPLITFTYLLILTQSRGGLLGLVAAVAAFFASKLGWRKALPLAAIIIPALLFTIGGRQANISLSGGTGQDRLRIWSDGLIMMSQPRSLLIGIGVDKFQEEVGYVAHNSYVHAFVETGMIGGVIFSGMFLLAFGVVFRKRSAWFHYYVPVLARMQPYLLAIIADYLVCMFSLSRNYVVTTYMMLGICTVFVRMAMNYDEIDRAWYKMDFRMIILVSALGICVFVVLKVFLMAFVQFGT